MFNPKCSRKKSGVVILKNKRFTCSGIIYIAWTIFLFTCGVTSFCYCLFFLLLMLLFLVLFHLYKITIHSYTLFGLTVYSNLTYMRNKHLIERLGLGDSVEVFRSYSKQKSKGPGQCGYTIVS